jgi:hypothetical protein
MGWIIALAIILAVAALDLAMLQGAKADAPPASPYTRSRSLFTPAERSFLRVLDEVVGDKARVFSKVRLAEVVAPGAGMSREDRNEAEHRLNHSRFDFLLCKPDDLSVICAIMLEDGARFLAGQSHARAFLREVCHAAGVPLVQVPAGLASTLEEVSRRLAPHLVAVRIPE